MIDIVEAGKFYLECLKKVHESILEQDVLPENKVLNAKANIVQYSGSYFGKQVVGAFDLNGRTHTFKVDIGLTDSKSDIVRGIATQMANVIVDATMTDIDWGSDETP